MTLAMAHLIERALVPLFIATVVLLAWRNRWRVITALSTASLGLGLLNLLVYSLEFERVIQFTTSRDQVLPIDVARFIVFNLSVYGSIAAWILGLALAAQARQFGWLLGMLVVATLSLVTLSLAENPTQYFTRQSYSLVIAVLLDVAVHIVAVITLLYGLLGEKARAAQASASMLHIPSTPTMLS